MTDRTRSPRSAFPDNELFLAAETTLVLAALEPPGAGELPSLLVGVLAHRATERVGDAIVADRHGRHPRHQRPDSFKHRHSQDLPLSELAQALAAQAPKPLRLAVARNAAGTNWSPEPLVAEAGTSWRE